MKKDLDTYTLTKQELLIMKIIWERGRTTVKDVYETLSRREPKAYTTILTLMKILERKGVLSRKRKGHCHLYHPILSRRQATRNQINELLDQYFEGNLNLLIDNVLRTELQIVEPNANFSKWHENPVPNRHFYKH